MGYKPYQMSIKSKFLPFGFGLDGSLQDAVNKAKEPGSKLVVYVHNIELEDDFAVFDKWFGNTIRENIDTDFVFREFTKVSRQYCAIYPNLHVIGMSDRLESIRNNQK